MTVCVFTNSKESNIITMTLIQYYKQNVVELLNLFYLEI